MRATRRGFFQGAVGGGILTAAVSSARAQNRGAVQLADRPSTEPLGQPEERRSRNGLLDTTLAVQYSHHYIDNDLVYLRTYEGSLVGPTLRVRRGDVLKVRILNCLPADLPAATMSHDMNRPHDINVTNLHTHGLHISPSGNADNVLLEIASGGSFPYEFKIEDDHADGTFWYHAHKHGSSAVQLGSGMAGAIIIEGPLDDFLNGQGFGDRILVLQQIPYSFKYDDDKKQNIPATVEWPNVYHDKFSRFTLVNGELKPKIVIEGKAERWRLIHGGISEMEDLALQDSTGKNIPLKRIAVDGITTGKVDNLDFVEMGPGYRIDILVKLPAGNYKLVKLGVPASRSLRGNAEEAQELADVEVRGEAPQMLPSDADMGRFVPALPNVDTITGEKRIVTFSAQPVWPSINGAKFQPDTTLPGAINQRIKLNTTDEWVLGNETLASPGARRYAHPFHIHINPFKVMRILDEKGQAVTPEEYVWRDTILVRPKYRVTLRSHYQRFTGRAVLHCHILSHEDEGMMQIIDIRP